MLTPIRLPLDAAYKAKTPASAAMPSQAGLAAAPEGWRQALRMLQDEGALQP